LLVAAFLPNQRGLRLYEMGPAAEYHDGPCGFARQGLHCEGFVRDWDLTEGMVCACGERSPDQAHCPRAPDPPLDGYRLVRSVRFWFALVMFAVSSFWKSTGPAGGGLPNT
jgi:hypothetical protein